MSQTAASNGRSYSNSASVRVSVGPVAGPLLCRVVSIVAARADCPVDRLDDALLICDAISAHAPDYVVDDYVGLLVNARSDGLDLRLGPLESGGGQAIISAATLPGVGNVLERVADELHVESVSDGGELLVIGLGFH
jgi:serine/threonine-protein kinase RsbW